MKKWLRRIRGAVGMGLTWAVAWLGLGALLMLPLGFPAVEFLIGALGFGALGLMGGTVFSVVLQITEGRRTFSELSLPRFAVWGAVGGFLMSLPVITTFSSLTLALLNVGITSILAAGSAAGSLALARRAEDRELLEAGADVADIGLTDEEKVELLG